MRRFLLLAIATLNVAVIGLCVYDHVCLRAIRSDFSKLTYSLHGPLDESAQLPEPKTMQELRAHYERTIATRWNIMNQSMGRYAAFQTAAKIHTGLAVLFVASTFLSFFLVGRLKPETNRVNETAA